MQKSAELRIPIFSSRTLLRTSNSVGLQIVYHSETARIGYLKQSKTTNRNHCISIAHRYGVECRYRTSSLWQGIVMNITPGLIRFTIYSLVISACCLLSPRLASAQDDVVPPPSTINSRGSGGNGSIAGRVVLPSGQPVAERCRVTLSSMRETDLTIYTDNNGGFGFGNLPEAIYTLEIAGDPK